MKRRTPSEPPSIPSTAQPSNGSIDTVTLELLAIWRVQDATNNPDEIRAAEEEIADFKKAMNDHRRLSGEPLLYP